MAPLRGPFPYKTLALTPALALPTGGRKRRRGRAELADFVPLAELVARQVRTHERERARRPGTGLALGVQHLARRRGAGGPRSPGEGVVGRMFV